jgi:uncharacterized protein DUF4388
VTSEGRSGLLYISDGRIVHAAAGRISGEPAIREMLSWGKGTFARFDAFEGAWPMFETITASTQSVLLRAAQFLDEGAGNLVALPGGAERDEGGKPKAGRPLAPAALSSAAEVDLAMRLSPDGDLLERQGPGPDAEGFCDAVAYAAQLTDLVAELLGLEPFENVELTFHEAKCVLSRQPDRTLLAARATARGTFEALRQRLGMTG